tara:strand:+ start:8107 stop:8514 length:408 start_codon:yes stop_codon:yes gene_type:complete
MIFPIKIMDGKGKVKEEKCLTQQQAVDNYWVDKDKKSRRTNNVIFALSAAERLTWDRMAKEEIIVTPKYITRRKRKPVEKIHEITCQRCGKKVMKTVTRAKWCGKACYRAVNIANARKNKNNQKRRLRERLGEVL